MNKIVFIGDSLTAGFDWQRRFPDHEVINLGISGETIDGLLGRRERIRGTIGSPAVIFVMTGINNIANGQYDIATSYRELVRNLTTRYKKSKIVIQSILPVALEWVSNDLIVNTNRHLEQIAHAYSAEYLDVYRLFVDAKGVLKKGYLQDDGVHLSTKGYEAWANEVDVILRNP